MSTTERSNPGATLVIADACRLQADAMALALSSRGYRVEAIATTGSGLLRAVSACHPDTCLLDLRLLDGHALDMLNRLHAREPELRVVVLSRSTDPRAAADAVEAGAVGYLGKDKSLNELDRALRRVAVGELFIEPTLAQEAMRHTRERPDGEAGLLRWLTQREREVLRRLTEGDDTTDIARALGMTANTTRTHVQNVLDKLGVHSRLEAVALANRASARH